MKKIKPIKIGSRFVGTGYPVYIIFEVASTHANDWEIAKRYVSQAKEAGADALKFQLFEADKLLNPLTSGLKGTYDYFKKSETPRRWFPKLLKLCKSAQLDLLCTPFDEESATFLNNIGVPAMKIASGELTNHQLLAHVAKFGIPVILSTGMATMEEIRAAVKVLQDNGCKDLVLLQCVSVYPMPYEDANVRVMQTLQEEFGCIVGYSDNGSEGHIVPLLAVALGASIIEKHVTSQKARGNLDDKFSMSVEEFTQMVKRIRQLEKEYKGQSKDAVKDLKKEFGDDVQKALGNGVKIQAPHGTKITNPGVKGEFIQKEADERHWARRGVYPARMIPKGTIITSDMLIALRPYIGVSAPLFNQIIGKVSKEDLPAKYPIMIEGNRVRRFKKKDIAKTYIHNQEKQFVKVIL